MASDMYNSERALVANACRVLAHRGLVDDILGHVSFRVSDDAVLVRCRGPRERGLLFTEVDDIREVRLDGTHELPDGYSVPNELPLHLAVLRADDSIRSVVHAHPPDVVAFSLTGARLRPIVGAFNIPAMRLAQAGIPIHPSAALIRNNERASAMVASLGTSPVGLLRGHGLVAAGASVEQATIRAIGVDALARLSLRVLQTGAVAPEVDEADLSDLPDLGTAFNDANTWRFHLAALDHAHLLVRSEGGPVLEKETT